METFFVSPLRTISNSNFTLTCTWLKFLFSNRNGNYAELFSQYNWAAVENSEIMSPFLHSLIGMSIECSWRDCEYMQGQVEWMPVFVRECVCMCVYVCVCLWSRPAQSTCLWKTREREPLCVTESIESLFSGVWRQLAIRINWDSLSYTWTCMHAHRQIPEPDIQSMSTILSFRLSVCPFSSLLTCFLSLSFHTYIHLSLPLHATHRWRLCDRKTETVFQASQLSRPGEGGFTWKQDRGHFVLDKGERDSVKDRRKSGGRVNSIRRRQEYNTYR